MDVSILEIRNAKELMIDREWLNGMMPTIDRLLAGDIRTDKMEKRMQARVTMMDSGNSYLLSDRSDDENHGTQVQSEEAYLNIIYINGPITRNGGACTYGSKQIRNLMMQATDDEDCKGHVWIIDTPGGVSGAVSDFRMAVDYAHDRGLLVDGIIDGCCLSLGVYAGQMCDHLYYTSPTDKIGSVGVYSIIDVMKNGDVNPTTGERHYEIYDPESYDKNDDYRQLAEEGKTDLIIERVAKSGVEFREFVKSRRPKAKDEMLHGKYFDCKDVDGILVDGQRTMQEVFSEVMNHYYSTHKIQNEMTEKYQTIAQLAGAVNGKFETVDADGLHMNTELLDTLQTNIEGLQAEAAKVADLTQKLADQKAEFEAKLAEKDAEHATAIEAKDKALADAQEAHTAALAAKDEEIKTLGEAVENYKQAEAVNAENTDKLQKNFDGAQAALATAEQTIAERDQQISDLNARITELENDPGQEPQAGASPENNGEGAQAATIAIDRYAYDNSLSYEENMKRKAEFEKA